MMERRCLHDALCISHVSKLGSPAECSIIGPKLRRAVDRDGESFLLPSVGRASTMWPVPVLPVAMMQQVYSWSLGDE